MFHGTWNIAKDTFILLFSAIFWCEIKNSQRVACLGSQGQMMSDPCLFKLRYEGFSYNRIAIAAPVLNSRINC